MHRLVYRRERTDLRQGKAGTMTGDKAQQQEGSGGDVDAAISEPTITAAYTARWTDASGPNPGERKKSVIRNSHIAPASDDNTGLNNTGFSITLTESFVPGVTDRYHVRWRDDDHDETETFVSRADALAAYERRIRDYRPRADGPDEAEARPGTSPASTP